MGRGTWLAAVAGVGGALGLAAPAPAEARSLRVEDRALSAGEAVRVTGTGWGTTVGICAAGPIEVELVRHRRRWRLARLGGLDVYPVVGSFSVGVRIPDSVSRGPARIVATQREYEFRGLDGCVPRPPARRNAGIVVYRHPDNRCEEPACTPVVLRPRIALDFLYDLAHHNADWRSLEEFPPLEMAAGGCLEPPCGVREDEELSLGLPLVLPGASAQVLGDTWEIPENCPDRVRFSILDSSGTGHALRGHGDVDAEGRLAASPQMPRIGVAAGRARLMASTDSADPRCALVASLEVQVRRSPREVWTVTRGVAKLPPNLLRLRGLGWKTDRCDSLVELVLAGGRKERLLRRVRPGVHGSFEAVVRVPARLPSGGHVVARQSSRAEVPGLRGDPRKSRCRGPRRPYRAGAESFPVGVGAIQDGSSLRVIGAGWRAAACAERPNPVTVEVWHGERWHLLAQVSPRGDMLDASLAMDPAIPTGSPLRATQLPCLPGEKPLTAATATRARTRSARLA